MCRRKAVAREEGKRLVSSVCYDKKKEEEEEEEEEEEAKGKDI